MVDILVGFLPDKLVLVCTGIAFVMPYAIHRVNKKLHETGDPTWKQKSRNTMDES